MSAAQNHSSLPDDLTVAHLVEMGSFDPMLGAFTPTKFLGSPGNSVCATGFDQVSFIEAVSSDLFNGFNTSVSTAFVN